MSTNNIPSLIKTLIRVINTDTARTIAEWLDSNPYVASDLIEAIDAVHGEAFHKIGFYTYSPKAGTGRTSAAPVTATAGKVKVSRAIGTPSKPQGAKRVLSPEVMAERDARKPVKVSRAVGKPVAIYPSKEALLDAKAERDARKVKQEERSAERGYENNRDYPND